MFDILDPQIDLVYSGLLTTNDHIVEVKCTIDEPAGMPFFSLWYEGTGSKTQFSILAEGESVASPRVYRQETCTAVMRVPPEGIIICQVYDMLGLYKQERPLLIKGISFSMTPKSSDPKQIISHHVDILMEDHNGKTNCLS